MHLPTVARWASPEGGHTQQPRSSGFLYNQTGADHRKARLSHRRKDLCRINRHWRLRIRFPTTFACEFLRPQALGAIWNVCGKGWFWKPLSLDPSLFLLSYQSGHSLSPIHTSQGKTPQEFLWERKTNHPPCRFSFIFQPLL